MKLTSRKADLEKDGNLLLNLDNECFNRPFDLPSSSVNEQVTYLKDSLTFIYYDGDKPIGFFAYEPQENNQIELKTMAVIPSYQNKGVGKKMADDFLKRVKGKRVHTVTHPKNTAAIILYLKHGFQIYGWKNNYYGDGEPRLLLKLE